MPLISLIIPVYNVEKYLKNCVDSVIKQNYEDMEIILVDDGSKDNSPRICDEYSEKYDFINVIHQKNGGASVARNTGIDAATGKYLMFIDSDDWWNQNVSLKSMVDYVLKHPKTEMFLFTSFDYEEDFGYLQRNEHKNFADLKTDSVESYYKSLLDNGNMEVSACTKILKRDFVINEKLYFKSGLVCEDNEWMIRILRVIKDVDIINEPLFICRSDRKGSVTHTIKEKNVTDVLSVVQESIDFYKSNDNPVKNYELCFASYLWFSALGLCTYLTKEERKNVKKHFKDTSSVLSYSNSKKTKLSRFVYKIFGFNNTICILGSYIKYKSGHNISRTKVSGN